MNGDNHDELNGTKCFCGRKKKGGMSVCFNDWKKLPAKIKRDLYNPDCYDETLAKAKAFLNARKPGGTMPGEQLF
jgi:hypothetical protein